VLEILLRLPDVGFLTQSILAKSAPTELTQQRQGLRVTLLIVFLATGNIAIGYALAVYLGHGQLPWHLGSAMVPRPVASPSSREELVEPEELGIPDEEINEAFEVPAIEQGLEEETALTEENPEAPPEAPIEEVVSDRLEAVEDPIEVAPVDEVAHVVEEVVGEVEAAVETEEEEIAASDEKIPEPPATDVSVEVSDQQAGTEEKLDEKFLEGIAAFQSQLEQSEEESAEEVESETAQDEAAPSEEPIANPVETATDVQEESSISDDVLAGIESFRAQLATMQQKSGEEESNSDSETSEKESVEQPVG